MPQNWFDVGNAILGAGTGLIGGIDKLQKDKQLRALELKKSGYAEDASGNLNKTDEQKKKEAFEQVEKQAGLLKSGFAAKYDPVTGEAKLEKVPGFKDTENETKALQLRKLKQEVDEGPKPTDQQSNAALFGRKAQESEQDLKRLEDSGYDPTTLGSQIKQNPFLGGGLGLLHSAGIGGSLTDVNDDNMYKQAKQNFISSTLRRESGASISRDEQNKADAQYFRHAGEGKEVGEQKSRNRSLSTQGILAAAGPRALKALPAPAVPPPLARNHQGGGLIGSAQAGQPPVVHTKETLGALSDDQLRALMAGKQ